MGRYYLDKEGKSAEMAFVVRENKRRTGMGTALLEKMKAVARHRKLESLWAFTASDNLPMLELFRKAGARIEATEEKETMRVVIDKPLRLN